jgi:hypothetical protein
MDGRVYTMQFAYTDGKHIMWIETLKTFLENVVLLHLVSRYK